MSASGKLVLISAGRLGADCTEPRNWLLGGSKSILTKRQRTEQHLFTFCWLFSFSSEKGNLFNGKHRY
jgi:hypothetical protein